MKPQPVFMAFPKPQQFAIFLQRKQRFLVEMELQDGTTELVYCANSGAMTDCLRSGMQALIWDSEDLTRKRRFTWRAIQTDGLWVGTDTHISNRIVEEALKLHLIPGLEAYSGIMRERLIEPGIRVDFAVSCHSGECLIEVKSTNVVVNGVARYPDCATPRGVKQLEALARKAAEGHRVVVLFLVQRSDAHSFEISTSAGCAYSNAFKSAVDLGVEMIVMAVAVHPEGFGMPRFLYQTPEDCVIKNDKANNSCRKM